MEVVDKSISKRSPTRNSFQRGVAVILQPPAAAATASLVGVLCFCWHLPHLVMGTLEPEISRAAQT